MSPFEAERAKHVQIAFAAKKWRNTVADYPQCFVDRQLDMTARKLIPAKSMLRFVAVLAALFGAFAMPATSKATTYSLGSVTAGTKASDTFYVPPGTFNDSISFAVSSSGDGRIDVEDEAINFWFFQLLNISDFSIKVFDPNNSVIFSGLVANNTNTLAQDVVINLPGTYTAELSGKAVGLFGGLYEFGVTAPAPEPRMYLMILMGLAFLWPASRRSQTANPRATSPNIDGNHSYSSWDESIISQHPTSDRLFGYEAKRTDEWRDAKTVLVESILGQERSYICFPSTVLVGKRSLFEPFA